MTKPTSKSEADRLGKRGSYRFGAMAIQGLARPAPPRAFRPSFTRPLYAGPVAVWILAAIVATALIAVGAELGLWFVPFVVGLVTGIAVRWGGWRMRVTLPAVIVMAGAGWGAALWIPALLGLPIGATARTIAALAGLPADAAIAVGATLVVSVLQGLVGLWLGRALTPRPARD